MSMNATGRLGPQDELDKSSRVSHRQKGFRGWRNEQVVSQVVLSGIYVGVDGIYWAETVVGTAVLPADDNGVFVTELGCFIFGALFSVDHG